MYNVKLIEKIAYIVCIWNAHFSAFGMHISVHSCILLKNSGSRALFKRPTSTFFNQKNFKTEFYGTIYTFKNYFATTFLVFNNKRYPNRPIEEH